MAVLRQCSGLRGVLTSNIFLGSWLESRSWDGQTLQQTWVATNSLRQHKEPYLPKHSQPLKGLMDQRFKCRCDAGMGVLDDITVAGSRWQCGQQHQHCLMQRSHGG